MHVPRSGYHRPESAGRRVCLCCPPPHPATPSPPGPGSEPGPVSRAILPRRCNALDDCCALGMQTRRAILRLEHEIRSPVKADGSKYKSCPFDTVLPAATAPDNF